MTKPSQFSQSVTKSPILWGALGAVGFYALIHAIPPKAPGMTFVLRYFTHHPVEYIEMTLFSVGLAALILKIVDFAVQRVGLTKPPFEAATSPRSVEECDSLIDRIDRLSWRRQGEYYIARLRAALLHVRRSGSAKSLVDELRFLSDMDAGRVHNGYSLFRVIVWAIPIMGFLGTVIGITQALNAVDLQSPDKSMIEVLNGLGLKFDTTALALALSMVLMFVHFSVERAENSLLDRVDSQTEADLADRFAVVPVAAEGQFDGVRRIAEAMMQATDLLVQRQAELWQASVEAAGRQWAEMSQTAATHVQTAMQTTTEQLSRQTDVLQQAVAAAGEVTRLEDALNRNLTTLAGAKHFEQTVLSLAAAVNMLSARLAETPSAPIRLEPSRRSVHAA
jgi:biopolymer transport protein ExbB/TolQ